MKKILLLTLILITAIINAQTFKKGAFTISISEGVVMANYTTKNLSSKANDINIENIHRRQQLTLKE